jgi:hypothetical protein
MAKAMKSAKPIEIRLVGVHSSLEKAAKKLTKASDPAAVALLKAITDFNTKSKCPQVMVFKFKA